MDTESRMTLRLPTELYEWLKTDADNNRRSLNSQVVEVLDTYRKQVEGRQSQQVTDAESHQSPVVV